MKITINPEYQNLVPKVSDEEYVGLKQSIKENGLWLPIIANSEGIILDGHTRFKICQELGVSIRFAERIFENKLLEKKLKRERGYD